MKKHNLIIIKHVSERGFTLVELLAVIAIIGVVGSVVFGILYSTLRSSSRTERALSLQQNGNYALTQMTKMIRFARTIQTPSTCYIDEDTTSVTRSSITIRNADNGVTTFACQGLPHGTIASNGASLLDTSEVEVTVCQFVCRQPSIYDAPSVEVSFTLRKKDPYVDQDASVSLESTSLPFKSTVTLRNLLN